MPATKQYYAKARRQIHTSYCRWCKRRIYAGKWSFWVIDKSREDDEGTVICYPCGKREGL